MTKTCCAHGCRSSTKKNPGLKFFDLSQAKGSLSEWLAAFPRGYRVDIVSDVTAGNTNAYSICEEHFSDNQRCQSPISIAESISINREKSSQTDNSNSLAMLKVSPVEIVDIQPDTNYFPEFFAASNIPAINNINIGAYSGLTYNTNPELVSNISSIQPRSENTQLPALYSNNNALLPAVQSSSRLNKSQKITRATKNPLNPVRIRPKSKPRVLKRNGKNTPELITNANSLSPNLQSNTNVVSIPGIPAATSFMQPSAYSVDPLLVDNANAIRLSPNPNNSVSVDNVLPCDVPIKLEQVDDRTLKKNSQDRLDEQQQGVEIQSENGSEEHRSNTLQTDDSHTASQEDEIVEGYVKFEIDESKEGNIETYCFFEDDSAKRRKVETDTTESTFRKVKMEIHPDRD